MRFTSGIGAVMASGSSNSDEKEWEGGLFDQAAGGSSAQRNEQ
jgi:hypothetical protein